MILQDNLDELHLSLNFRHDEFNYVSFATANVMRCFVVVKQGTLSVLVRPN